MKIVVMALASTIAMPALAGSLAAPVAEPTVVRAAPAPIAAVQSTRGYYGALSGLGAMPDATFTQDDDVPAPDGDLSLDDALGLSGAVGFNYGSGLRVEAELMHFGGDTNTLSFNGGVPAFEDLATDGTYAMTAGMLNAWYTFGEGTIRPFVGGGIGMMYGDVDLTSDVGGNPLSVSGTDTVFAWQVGAGVEVPVSDNMSVLASYRYIEASGFEFEDDDSTAIEADLNASVITVGAMFRF